MSQGTFAPLFEPAGVLAAIIGGAASLGVALLALSTRRRRAGPLPVAGLVIAGSATAVLLQVRSSAATAAVGIAVLALGGLLSDLRFRSLPILIATSLPGAWIIAFQSNLPQPRWITWFAFFAIALSAPLVARFGHGTANSALGPPLYALTALGIFFTVPDTEEAAVLLTAAVPVALLGWPIGAARLGGAGSYAVIGITAWVVAWGGYGRPASIIGAMACLGVLLVEPVATLVTRRSTFLSSLHLKPSVALLGIALHFVLVVVTSRVAGIRTDLVEATLLAGAALTVAVAVLGFTRTEAVVPRSQGERDVSSPNGANGRKPV